MDGIDFLKRKEVKAFIQENIAQDVTQLLLNPPKKWKSHIKVIADQIFARQKAQGKLPQWAQNFDLIFPPPLSIEQASSASTGQYKSGLLSGEHLIDLTGGMGIDCLWIGQGFKKVSYVEQNDVLCETFRHNSKTLGKKVEIENSAAEDFLEAFEGKAVFYIDPARRNDTKQKVFKLEDCTPNLLEIQQTLFEKAQRVLVKLSPLMDLSILIGSVNGISEIHIVSVKNDCKEILVLLEPNQKTPSPKIVAVNLDSDQPDFSFYREEEGSTQISYGYVSGYVYEPNASILKAGAFKAIAQRYDVTKLSANTHLYTSEYALEKFPGKSFKVLAPNAKHSLREYAVDGHLNVMTRNYTSDSAQLKKKYKLKDGGKYYLIGFRDRNNKPQLVIADRVL